MELLLAMLAAYLLGSANFSLLVCRWRGRVDLRRTGSGNPGMSNAYRVLGPRWAALILVLDAGRGVLLAAAAQLLFTSCWQQLLVCLALLAGNLFPLFHQFRGGKGFATSMGMYLAVQPLVAVLCGTCWLLAVYLTRLASLATLLSASLFPLLVLALERTAGCSLGLGLVILVVVLFSHRANLRRLLRGTEHRFNR